MDRGEKIIPSTFENYFKTIGIEFPMKKIFLLFKRFSESEDGKMPFNSFCRIFDVCNSNSIYTRIEKNRKVRTL